MSMYMSAKSLKKAAGELKPTGAEKKAAEAKDDKPKPVFVASDSNYVLCDLGYGRLLSTRDDGIVEIELASWGAIAYVHQSSIRRKLSLVLRTFHKPKSGSGSVPGKLELDVDLSRPPNELLHKVAAAYGVGDNEVILACCGRELRYDEGVGVTVSTPLSEEKSDAPASSDSAGSAGAAGAASASAAGGSAAGAAAGSSASSASAASAAAAAFRRFDLCGPQGPYNVLVVVDEKRLLRFKEIMDTNGLMHLIGTKENTKPWQNPIRAGWVQVTLSSSGGDDSSCIAERSSPLGQAAENSYGDDSDPWLSIFFRGYSICPTHYVLFQQGDHLLRNWTLEGSNDPAPEVRNKRWETICSHTNDESLQAQGSAVFRVQPQGHAYYNNIRIHVTGNSHKGQPNFDISQFEIYGYVKTPDAKLKGAPSSQEF